MSTQSLDNYLQANPQMWQSQGCDRTHNVTFPSGIENDQTGRRMECKNINKYLDSRRVKMKREKCEVIKNTY
jgi:hypothetical protein